MRKIVSLLVVSLVIVFSSCGNKEKNNASENDLRGSIQIDGSSTVYPLTEAVAEDFRSVQPNVRVTIGVSGTGGGFQKFARGETHISNASRKIKESEIKTCEENNISFEGFLVAYDGMAIIANPQNDWLENITVEELKQIWQPEAQGTIKKWNQIRPEWPDEMLYLYGAGTASGTYDYFTEVINGKSGSSRGDYTASEDDNVLVQGVMGDKFALGFFGLAYYEENKDKLKLIAVDNGNGPVYPTEETVLSGAYSPLSRPMFIYVNETAIDKPEIIAFVNFYLDNSTQLARDVGYVAAPKAENDNSKKKFADFVANLKTIDE